MRDRPRQGAFALALILALLLSAADADERDQAALAAREDAAEPVTDGPASDPDGIHFGGALRYNATWNGFDRGVRQRRGDSGFDIFRINAGGRIDSLTLSAEYRFYSYMHTLHHGWVGYDFDNQGEARVGVMQVPFGLLPYASHNFWFGIPYYLGLEDDYDLGMQYLHASGPWDVRVAFFKNEELGNAADLGRYSYDPVLVDDDPAAANEEVNTFNGRVAYTFGRDTDCTHEAGMSGQWGELYNHDTGLRGDHWAGAVHLDSHCGRWNPQFQVARYGYSPRNPAGVSTDTITVGAFEFPHQIAARGTLAVINLAYNLPVNWPAVRSLTCYNDFSLLRKDRDAFDDSYLNTTGCVVNAGPTWTYFDVIRARNMIFFGDGSLADAGSNDWETRVNINFGYYW